MERLLIVWGYVGHIVYPIGWLGSYFIFKIHIGIGILIGLGFFFIWWIVYNLLYRKVIGDWFWND